PPALLLAAVLTLPIHAWLRPGRPSETTGPLPLQRDGDTGGRAATSRRLPVPPPVRAVWPALVAAAAAGALHATVWEQARRQDCRLHLGEGAELALTGRVEAAPARGRLVLRVEGGLQPGCRGAVRVVLP